MTIIANILYLKNLESQSAPSPKFCNFNGSCGCKKLQRCQFLSSLKSCCYFYLVVYPLFSSHSLFKQKRCREIEISFGVGGGGGFRIKFNNIGGTTMVGSDAKFSLEINPSRTAKNACP